ncbi:protein kinase-like protein [Aneurinibacillus soli]|uniref:Serine/threonine-protein kinase StkP n=1 Tax=Aneurinibacillus soli TaxID=1500254 RepID=A0A0U5AY56_9BACL|nr:serine/threonine-protein kinase [Aneurinibacillus soli]PYE62624.1 protein kinase-like protein [Aneurinibacillus soli]BAU27186.1 Serine/threonine-protein kinase StkP [Aneurinibacillus soli]
MREREAGLKKNTIVKNTYQIKKAISCSDLSIVYIGRHIMSKEYCIIKEWFPRRLALRDLDHRTLLCRLPSLKQKYEELKASFFREARILKEIQHRNIVTYMDHFEENGTGYIVTEYCRGRTLDQYIQQADSHCLADFFKHILLPLLDVVHFLHKKGILHRDIKPANIVRTKDGQLKLLDFGSAVHYTSADRYEIFTTTGFSPLEFYSARSRQRAYSDIYSLSATIYYCLSGKPPLDVAQRMIEDNLVAIKDQNGKVSSFFSYIVMKGLAVDYRRRTLSLSLLRTAAVAEYIFLKTKSFKAGL